MSTTPGRPRVRVSSPASLLAVIPYLIGFTPTDSWVVLGGAFPAGRVQVVLRYDLPDPPGPGIAAEIATHAAQVLAREQTTTAVAIGYGAARLVTPLADALRLALPPAGIALRDVLRVEGHRYWSYLCQDPSCCPVEGVPFDVSTDPAAQMFAAAGQTALAGRDALAATIAPVTGADAEAMAQATRRAERAALKLITRSGPRSLDRPGLALIRSAIEIYRSGRSITTPGSHAWLSVVLVRLQIRDDAWSRLDPAHHRAHRRLWTDVTRRAQPGYVAAPACLLAVAAWQGGDGALANLALDRALADNPTYSMALLLRDAITAGVPPSAATPLMTPAEVADSYATQDTEPGQDTGPGQDAGNPDGSAPGTGTG